MKIYPSSVSEDILLCSGAVYASAAFATDLYILESVMLYVRPLWLVASIVIWCVLSFTNGLRLRKSFMLLSLAANAFPPMIFFIIGRVRIFKFSDIGILLSEISKIISRFPYLTLEEKTGINGMYFSLLTEVMCLLLFAAGYVYTKKTILACLNGGAERN